MDEHEEDDFDPIKEARMSQSVFQLFLSAGLLKFSLLVLCLGARTTAAPSHASGSILKRNEGGGAFSSTPSAFPRTPTASIADTSAARGEIIQIPIIVNDATGIAGAEIKVIYDPDILTALDARTTDLTSDFVIANTVLPGKIAISLAHATGITADSGAFIMIAFRVAADAIPCSTTTIAFARLSLYDEKTDSIPATPKNGLFTIKCSQPPSQPSSEVTVSPNPFTPNNDTFNDRARFQFSNEITASTEVLIFNIAGRRVKSLSATSGKSIEWDGRDDNGHDLRPGVYLYIIRENGSNIKNGTVTLMR